MKNFRSYLCLILGSIALNFPYAFSGTEIFEPYWKLLEQYPHSLGPLGNSNQKEIEIILDPQKMQEIEKATGRVVGLVHRDTYWIWLNDAVRFPSGKYGVYGRILWVKSLKNAYSGIAVMPVLPDGTIVLNLNYRHPTRSWEFELPRGLVEDNETLAEAAKREALEETGMVIQEIVSLGTMAIDSGITNNVVPVFLAKVVAKQEPSPEDSEAIASIHSFTIDELKKGYIEGFLIWEDKKIPLRDPFLTFALFQAQNRMLLTP